MNGKEREMETNAEVLEKIKKLLRLAQSDNPNEAALAAAKAQELMDRHQIQAAMLDEKGAEEPDEDIVHFSDRDDALDDLGGRRAVWKGSLASTISEHNACVAYYSGSRIVMVGRPTDVAAVRYLYVYAVKAIEDLVKKQGAGHGRTWYNNYRQGCVKAISEKLWAQRQATYKEVRSEAKASGGGAALVKVENAITRFDEKKLETKRWTKKHLNLRSGGRSYSRHDHDAFSRGKRDGASINMGGGPALGSGTRGQLKG